MNWEKYPNFSPEEFACQHCGAHGISELLLDKIQLLRTELGFPFKITSGYRCKDHPIEKKKVNPGAHRDGLAADIGVRGQKAYEVISQAKKFGFTGIGVAQKGNSRFIHLDVSPQKHTRPRPWIWSYQEIIMEFLFWIGIIVIGLGFGIKHFQPNYWETLKKLIKK